MVASRNKEQNLSRSGNTYIFVQENGVLYRRCHLVSGQLCKQLVVPKRLRDAVHKMAHEGITSTHQGAREPREEFWMNSNGRISTLTSKGSGILAMCASERLQRINFASWPSARCLLSRQLCLTKNRHLRKLSLTNGRTRPVWEPSDCKRSKEKCIPHRMLAEPHHRERAKVRL